MLQKSCFPMGPFIAQGLTTLVASLTMFSAGMIFGWVSPTILKLQYDPGELMITEAEGSWVVSFASIGAVFGPIILNLVVDRIGRKWSLILIVIPMLISWIIVGLATRVEVLYAGRFIGGLSLGAVYSVMPMYLGEIAEDRIRGGLSTIGPISINLGMLLSFAVGPWISRPTLSIVSAVPPLIFLLLSPWIPETPYYLLMKGARNKAGSSLAWLRQRTDIKEELSNMEMMVVEEQKNRNGFAIATLFRSSANLRAVVVAFGLITFQQTAGVIAIQSYAGTIFLESGLTGWNNYSVIIMGIVKLVAGICAVLLVDVAGRRPMLMLSSIFTSTCLMIEAVFFHLKSLGHETQSYSWTPLLGILGFYLFYVPGYGSIPNIMGGELFPTDVKAPANMLLSMYGSLMGFLVVQVYQSLGSAHGIHWVFYGFAVITLSGISFIYFLVPETKRASFEEIQIFLKSDHSNPSNLSLSQRNDREKS